MSQDRPEQQWHEIVVEALKANAVRLFTYVPDRVLSPLIHGIPADPDITALPPSREEEALGILGGADMAGCSACSMQTSGFATLPNALASPRCALSDPGADHGLRTRHARRIQDRADHGLPHHAAVLESLGIEHHTLTRQDEMRLHRRSLDQAGRQLTAPRAHPLAAADRREGLRGE